MKYKRCNAALLAGACTLALAAAAVGRAPTRKDDANGVVARAVTAAIEVDALTAVLRFRGRIMNRNFVGAGQYLQFDDEGELLCRLATRMGQGDDQPRMSQVHDPDGVLWTLSTIEGEETLTRVDLRRLKRVAYDDELGLAAVSLGTGTLTASGGLPQLLSALAESFDFTTIGTRDERRIVVLQGRWKPEALRRLAPKQSDQEFAAATAVQILPEHAPDHVRLELGADDLFPYSVSYRRTMPDEAAPRELLLLQFLEVKRPERIPRSAFRFNATGRDYVDLTDDYIARAAERKSAPQR